MPQNCQGDMRRRAGPAGAAGSPPGRTRLVMRRARGTVRQARCGHADLTAGREDAERPPRAGPRRSQPSGQPATSLMRAIISSTAFSTGTFSFSTRFIAFAQTFSLLSVVNL